MNVIQMQTHVVSGRTLSFWNIVEEWQTCMRTTNQSNQLRVWPILNGTTAWDDPVSNQTYIFVVNKALYYGTKLDHYLLNPNHIRY